MKLKTLVLVVAILAVLSVAAYFLQRPPARQGADARIGQPVFDANALNHSAKIRLSDQGKNLLLARQPDGQWTVPSYYDLPADVSKLSRFIEDLSNGKIQRLVTENPERLARMGFKDTSVALLDAADKPLWTLTLGKDAEGGGRFVRYDDEKKGYQASLAVFIDSTPKNWADTRLLDLKPDDVAGVELSFAEGDAVTATRAKKDDAWTAGNAPAGQRIRGERIASLLSSLGTLRFEDTSDPADANVEAARKHSRTVKLTTFDHKTFTIEIGRKPEEKKVVEAANVEVKGTTAPAAGQAPAPANATSAAPAGTEAGPKAAPLPAAKPEEPKTETIPAGPVYCYITSSDGGASINALMKKRAFQTFEWNFTSLPAKRDELFEPVPAPPALEKTPAAPAAAAKSGGKP